MVIIKSKMSASKAQVIANKWSAAPREAYVRMLGALKAVEIYVEKIVIRNRYNIMIDKGLATEEVKATVDRILGKEERKKQTRNKEERRLMGIRKRNIEKEMRKAKYQWYERSKELRQIMNLKMYQPKGMTKSFGIVGSDTHEWCNDKPYEWGLETSEGKTLL